MSSLATPLRPFRPLTRASFAGEQVIDDPPFTQTIVLARRWEVASTTGRHDSPVLATNVPHLVVQHSPTGFNWGYNGSGPADLALNIVEAVLRTEGYVGPRVAMWDGTCFALTVRLYQTFKAEVIAGLHDDDIALPYADVAAWVASQRAQHEAMATADDFSPLAPQYAVEVPGFWEDEMPMPVTLFELRFYEGYGEVVAQADGLYRGTERVAQPLTLDEYDAAAGRR